MIGCNKVRIDKVLNTCELNIIFVDTTQKHGYEYTISNWKTNFLTWLFFESLMAIVNVKIG